MSLLRKIAVTLVVGGLLICLVTLWWWALYGVAKNVGAAGGSTGGIFMACGLICAVVDVSP